MKKLALALILTMLFQPLGFSASEWNKTVPGTTQRSDLDTVLTVQNEAVDRLVSNYRRGMTLAYASSATITAGVGEITCSNSAGTLRKFRANTSTTTITWANIDSGAEANSTTYYVYAVADADATTATFMVSSSATAPTGATYYKRLGSFYNNASGDIDAYSVTNDIPTKQVGLGQWTSGYSKSVVYQAATDMFVSAYGYEPSAGAGLQIKTDSSNPPSTIRSQQREGEYYTQNAWQSVGCHVRKGDYWMVEVFGSFTPTIYSISQGS